MEFIKIDSNFKDIEKLQNLKEEAFPGLDNVTIEKIISLQENKNCHAYAAYDNEQLVGFIVYISMDNNVYIAFLAVDKNCRGKGYGTKILTTVMNYYKDKYTNPYFILDVEKPRENAENLGQRKARIKLYERLGFYLTDIAIEYHDDYYLFMTNEENIRIEDHKEFSEFVESLQKKYDL